MAQEPLISRTIWNAIVTLAAIVGGTLYIVDHQDSNFDKKLAPLFAQISDLKSDMRRVERNMVVLTEGYNELKQREKINSACTNGAVSFINQRFGKSLPKPYDLFDKPRGIQIEEDN